MSSARSRASSRDRSSCLRHEHYLHCMTTPTAAQQRDWMAQWRSAATELARVGQTELEHVDDHRLCDQRIAADEREALITFEKPARHDFDARCARRDAQSARLPCGNRRRGGVRTVAAERTDDRRKQKASRPATLGHRLGLQCVHKWTGRRPLVRSSIVPPAARRRRVSAGRDNACQHGDY